MAEDIAISFIVPSRNNLKYLKWAYWSIRKNLGKQHEICVADDASTDGTWKWLKSLNDPLLKTYRNSGSTRLGHTILYDLLIAEYATNDVVMIFHADMYAAPGFDDEILKHIKPGVVVSGTRVEPPLHVQGKEKLVKDFGIEPEEFDEDTFLEFVRQQAVPKCTTGVFAPWAIYKKDFQAIGGHDPLFAPQSKEDSDIFNRFKLAGYKFLQSWSAFVYHFTCRGSRFADGVHQLNPSGQVFMAGRETQEWLDQNLRSTRNFIRKWGGLVKHDEFLHPIVVPKYDIGLIVRNCNPPEFQALEPWCSKIFVDKDIINDYIDQEQPNTLYDLKSRIRPLDEKPTNDIVVEFDVIHLSEETFQVIALLPEILHAQGELGTLEHSIFSIQVNALTTYEHELIKVEK